MGIIKDFSRSLLVNILAVWILGTYVTGFQIASEFRTVILIAAAFTIFHFALKPIVEVLLGGINFITLGLFSVLVDSAIIYGLSRYTSYITLTSWSFPGAIIEGFTLPSVDFTPVTTAILAALIITILQTVFDVLT